MDKMILRIFQTEVERQCKFALIAAKDLQSGLDAINQQMAEMVGDPPAPPNFERLNTQKDRIWYSLQSILIAAGNISKLLWPNNPLIPDRGKELRESLSVSDGAPLQPRTFRNHFEHFDERLEKWATSSERHNFADSNIGPVNAIIGLDPGDYLRNFDPGTWVLTFRGDSYDLKPVIAAISELWEKASAEAQKPHWE